MSPDNAENDRRRLAQRLALYRILIAGLAGTNVINAFITGYVVTQDKTLITPPEIRRPYALGAGGANVEYFSDMADYVLHMILTVMPETVRHNNEVILKMTHPHAHGSLKTMLDVAAARIERDRITTIWVPQTDVVFQDRSRVKVEGVLKTYIADVLTSQRNKQYLVSFSMTHSGRLHVSGLEEILDGEKAGIDDSTVVASGPGGAQ